MIAIPVQKRNIIMTSLELIYNSLIRSGKPIKFYCAIKQLNCENLSNGCADCPLKRYQK